MFGTRLLSMSWKRSAGRKQWPLLAVDYDFRSAVWAYVERLFLLLLIMGVAFVPALVVWLIPLALSALAGLVVAGFTAMSVSHLKEAGLLLVVVIAFVLWVVKQRRGI
jgi:hypothetical protein